ncbi:hypothetical protein MJG53_004367 [Ovis ammon polii x Ovis aries]|uniref:Uncharacterized protein n=1 Tax=Ovis ammon polii x Ovis aries TaxID=2918886 RepID=A0ACB9V9G9_9CETA|nr:hypothetical protein MJT46_002398 [Ovis ammon polii x Ovis aries]KAI4586580.1 hypothetical protein MJG53_004367 [Ovis ammon polii x Ovis aries]
MVLVVRCILFSKIGAKGVMKNRAREERLGVSTAAAREEASRNEPLPFPVPKYLISLFHYGNGNKMPKFTTITFPRVVTYLCPFHQLGQAGKSCSWEEQAFRVSFPAQVLLVFRIVCVRPMTAGSTQSAFC